MKSLTADLLITYRKPFLQMKTSTVDTDSIIESSVCTIWSFSPSSSKPNSIVIPAGKEVNCVIVPPIDSWVPVQPSSLLVYPSSGQSIIFPSHPSTNPIFRSMLKCHHVGKRCPDLSRVTGEEPCQPYGNQKGCTSSTFGCDGDERWLGSLLSEQNVQSKRPLGRNVQSDCQIRNELRTILRTISNNLNRFWHAPKDVTYIKFFWCTL